MGFKIGNIELCRGISLAPMAGYTDRAMRLVCHENGCEYSTTEMVSAKAVIFGDKKTFNIARIRDDEGFVALQIFGSEPDVMARAAEILAKGYSCEGYVAPSAIDINMGCPVNKVFSNGEGSALMKNPELIYRITRAVSENIDIPCTVKIRSGIDEKHINAVECALAAESAGAKAVAIHGRTRSQLYGGKSDIEIIKKVKQSLHIPVIGNGDVVDLASAIRLFEETKCDGIMIGRSAVGNPFIFREILSYFDKEEYLAPTLQEKIDTAIRQLTIAIEDKGETVAIPEARKQIACYFKGFRGSAALRAKINTAVKREEVVAAILSVEE